MTEWNGTFFSRCFSVLVSYKGLWIWLGELSIIIGSLSLLMGNWSGSLNPQGVLNKVILFLHLYSFWLKRCSVGGSVHCFHRGLCKTFATTGKGISPTHLFFADDALLFGRADGTSVSNLMDFIERYELYSG